MSFSFRLKFKRALGNGFLDMASREISIPVADQRLLLTLSVMPNDKTAGGPEQLYLTGTGYDSAEEAGAAGHQFKNALMIHLARECVGVDFGDHTAPSFCTTGHINENPEVRMLNDIHGLMVYKSAPTEFFLSVGGLQGLVIHSDIFLTALTETIEHVTPIDDRELLAYTLFHASFFQPLNNNRLLLLILAIEAIIEQVSQPSDVIEHVDSLIAQTNSSTLQPDQKISLSSAIRQLRKETIGQAGRRLVNERLGNRIYGDKTAEEFFSYCYKLRSNLVHGSFPVPTQTEVRDARADLTTFVSDILTVPILGLPKQ